jgi:pimeloyl-ACP methyl ester carboxylesterase
LFLKKFIIFPDSLRSAPAHQSLVSAAFFAARFLAVWLLGVTVCFAQADYAREKRWADEITPAILVGDPVYLELKSGHKFLAIHASNPHARAGVIVVHGIGMHPDWGLINVLRSRLAEQGYATLSVQMPVLAADARAEQYAPLFPEAAARLRAAVAFLHGKGHRKIAVVSHSMGSRMTDFFLNENPLPQIDAWVAIGMSGAFTGGPGFKVPVLDLYGENDLPAVLQNAEKRAAALRTVRGSGQMQVAGADHFFNGQETALVTQVRQYLEEKLR